MEDSQGDISSDGGEYQDLPIIIESNSQEKNQPVDKKSDQSDPNEILKSRKIKSNTKIDLQSYEERVMNADTSNDSKTLKKNARVINKRAFDTESSKAQRIRVQENSPFGQLKSWGLCRIIVKSIDDVRQEQFAMQLISQIY